uniref:Uncharacterized protein n=1 Tax=Rhizophora mucronata TaxID=61149 RepID=A0A2P2MW91_RHIMU
MSLTSPPKTPAYSQTRTCKESIYSLSSHSINLGRN